MSKPKLVGVAVEAREVLRQPSCPPPVALVLSGGKAEGGAVVRAHLVVLTLSGLELPPTFLLHVQ